jgi:hypothetical protein
MKIECPWLFPGLMVMGWPLVDEFSLMVRCFPEKTSLLKNKGVFYA